MPLIILSSVVQSPSGRSRSQLESKYPEHLVALVVGGKLGASVCTLRNRQLSASEFWPWRSFCAQRAGRFCGAPPSGFNSSPAGRWFQGEGGGRERHKPQMPLKLAIIITDMHEHTKTLRCPLMTRGAGGRMTENRDRTNKSHSIVAL